MMKSPKVEPNPCNYPYLHSGGGEGGGEGVWGWLPLENSLLDKYKKGTGEGIPGLIDS